MPKLSEPMMIAFQDELLKTAGPNWHQLAGNAAALGGVGAGLGAAGGAAIGAVKGYRDARQQGASVGQAAMGGLGKSLSGAGRGALIGGAGGALASTVVKGDLKGLVDRSAFARSGQRQLHALTGWTPKAGLQSIRGGAHAAQENVAQAAGALKDAVGPDAIAKAQKGVARAGVAHAAATKAQDMGLTSVPGYLRSLKNNGVGNTVAAGAAEQWHSGGVGMKALTVGLPAMGAVSAIRKQEAPSDAEGKGENVGRELGRTVGGFVGAPMPFFGQEVAGRALGTVGAATGKVVDRLRGRKPGVVARPELETAGGQQVAGERVISPSAAGHGPEVNV